MMNLLDQYLKITSEASFSQLPSVQKVIKRNTFRNFFRKNKKSVTYDALELWKKGKLTQGQIKRAKKAKEKARKAKKEERNKKIREKIKQLRSKMTKKGK